MAKFSVILDSQSMNTTNVFTGLTATGGTAATIVDTGQGWVTNAYAGKYAVVTGGTNSGLTRLILSNTNDTLTTVAFPLATTGTTVYNITTADYDLIRITAGTRGFSLRSVTLRGDVVEASDKLMVSIYRATTAGTGTAVTPNSFEDGGATFDGTASVNLTVDSVKSPTTPLTSVSVDVGSEGVTWAASDGTDDIDVGAGHSIAIRLEPAPASATVLTCTAIVEQ